MNAEGQLRARCCIAGGGPAGVMLGFLLARAGIDTVVLEKHHDFFRDFRGDTIHPSTFQLMHELGVLDAFRAVKHQEITNVDVLIGDDTIHLASFASLPTAVNALGLMPQWDFLDFVASQGRRYPAFRLLMDAEVIDLVRDGQRVSGVRARIDGAERTIEAELVVAADGRRSTVREHSGLPLRSHGVPIDVLWMRLSRKPTDPPQVLGRVQSGRIMVMLDRDDYWQCAFVIPKGGFAAMRARPIETFRDDVAALAPFVADRVGELRSWEDVQLLTVTVDRLERWYRDGLVCIGDAAHAMSPVGGVGINLALQDAVAAANILVPAFGRGRPTTSDLAAIQKRRTFPTVVIQAFQVAAHDRVIGRVLRSRGTMRAPLLIRLFNLLPPLRVIPAFLIGIGPRPEHIRTPDVLASGGS